jgi:hypothetical protein
VWKELIAVLLCFLMVELGFPMMTQTQTQTNQTQLEKESKPQSIPGKAKPAEQFKKKKFPWLGILLVAGAAATAGILMLAACKSPTGPDPTDPPDPSKFYTLEFTYVRVDVKNANGLNEIPDVMFGLDGGEHFLEGLNRPTRIDDYHFTKILDNKYAAAVYCISAQDMARAIAKDGSLLCGEMIVGYKFILKIVETGFSAELTKIMTNTIKGFAHADASSTMARFMLKSDGTFVDY